MEKRRFPYRKPTAYITLPCATALACDTICVCLMMLPQWRVKLNIVGHSSEIKCELRRLTERFFVCAVSIRVQVFTVSNQGGFIPICSCFNTLCYSFSPGSEVENFVVVEKCQSKQTLLAYFVNKQLKRLKLLECFGK